MTDTTEIAMDGRSYLRAITYALAATPKGEERPDLQHVTFIGSRVVGSDGMSRHDAHLQCEIAKPISVARSSVASLIMALTYAERVSKGGAGTFSVRHEKDVVIISYGARLPIEHELAVCDVGLHPPDACEWVPEDAPINPRGMGHIGCEEERRALLWWRSWDKDYGTSEVRGGLDGGPIRRDITSGGLRVATAFLLPKGHAPAELGDAMSLFNGIKTYGRSNLELDLSGDGVPQPEPIILKLGDHEFNVTNLPGGRELLRSGPCDHRDTSEHCVPCTEEAIEQAKLLAAEEPKKKRGRRKKVEPDEDFDHLAQESSHLV